MVLFISGFASRAQLDLQGLFLKQKIFNLDMSIKSYIASADNRYLGYRGIGSEFSELAHRQYEPCEQYKVGYLNDLKNKTSLFGVEAIQAHGAIFKNICTLVFILWIILAPMFYQQSLRISI